MSRRTTILRKKLAQRGGNMTLVLQDIRQASTPPRQDTLYRLEKPNLGRKNPS